MKYNTKDPACLAELAHEMSKNYFSSYLAWFGLEEKTDLLVYLNTYPAGTHDRLLFAGKCLKSIILLKENTALDLIMDSENVFVFYLADLDEAFISKDKDLLREEYYRLVERDYLKNQFCADKVITLSEFMSGRKEFEGGVHYFAGPNREIFLWGNYFSDLENNLLHDAMLEEFETSDEAIEAFISDNDPEVYMLVERVDTERIYADCVEVFVRLKDINGLFDKSVWSLIRIPYSKAKRLIGIDPLIFVDLNHVFRFAPEGDEQPPTLIDAAERTAELREIKIAKKRSNATELH